MSDETNIERCECCGAEIRGGKAACNALFGEILAREYGDPTHAAVHLMTVDCYVLQHCEDHGPRSNAFHLLRLGWLLHGGDADIGQQKKGPMPFIMKSYREFPFLEPPEDRGAPMVVDIAAASDAAEHAEHVRAWGESVWSAWERHHAWVRGMLKQAGVELP